MMITTLLLWYALLLLIGWLVFPVTHKFFSRLADKGYGLSKVVGLLLSTFIFWLAASLGIIQNTTGGILLSFALIIGVSLWVFFRDSERTCQTWIKINWKKILFFETLFLLLFAGWTVMRASNPDIIGTEKPMELAFINSIMHSPTFPPKDPWLTGYAISYYYFGYVIIAMLAKLSGTFPWVAFNISGALWFALTGLTASSLLYNLLSGGSEKKESHRPGATLALSLLGPLYVLFVSNIEGFLEMLHAKGVFWQSGAESSAFWDWIGLKELVNAPMEPYSLIPQRAGGIWWWRASRVLQDFSFAGQSKEIIDEFPFFSYYLADLHPHVLAMPFVLLAVSVGLNAFFQGGFFKPGSKGVITWVSDWVKGENVETAFLRIANWVKMPSMWFAALVMGSLAFINTWDFPIYVALFAAAAVFREYQHKGWSWQRVFEFLEICILLGVMGVILYLPFYFGFASQAGGLLPSLHFFTQGRQLWIMFLPLLGTIYIWLFVISRNQCQRRNYFNGLKFVLISMGGLFLASYLFGGLLVNLPALGNLFANPTDPSGGISLGGNSLIALGDMFYGLQGSPNGGDIIWNSIARRISQPGTWITLAVLILLVWAVLGSHKHKGEDEAEGNKDNNVSAFVAIMILLGSGLVLFPEYFYLRDQFAWRMNTIFKFYFQTWILWGVAAAYASIMLFSRLKSVVKYVFSAFWLIVLLMSLAYPFFGIRAQLIHFDWERLTLNGADHIERYRPDEMQAILYLYEAPAGVVAEAVGGSYSGYARVATYSGQSNVLGWPGHESQWRGGAVEMGSREEDIRLLYQTNDWGEAERIIMQYNIRYIFVGSMENSAYRVNERKFENNLQTVFTTDNVKIYEVSTP